MLSKTNRLKKKKDFDWVFKKGKSWHEGFLVFRVAKSSSDGRRFGFVVGKNISKRANIRNKIKRRMRELMRRQMPAIKSEIEGVFIARPGLEKQDFQGLKETMEKILKKAKIYKNL